MKKVITLFFLCFSLSFFALPVLVQGQATGLAGSPIFTPPTPTPTAPIPIRSTSEGQAGSPQSATPTPTSRQSTGSSNVLTNPLGEDYSSINKIIGKVINSVMGIVGSLALLMFVYGGLTWMTSSGSQEKVKKGKDILIWSAIGLVVIFSAYGITSFIINFLSK